MANKSPDRTGAKPYEWKPGESGNPGGRPKHKPWSDAYRKYGLLPIAQLQLKPETDTVIEACVKKALLTTLKDPQSRMLREIADRTEGRVPLPLIGSTDEPIAILIQSHVPRPDRTKKPLPVPKKAKSSKSVQ